MRLRGRQGEARRNDERVLEAALEVLTRDPLAPMSAVAEQAGVGQASLYRRYPSKEALLACVCANGMGRMRDAAQAALETPGEPWAALCGFLHWYLESGTPQLAALLGAFSPDEALFELARETNELIQALVDRTARGAGSGVTSAGGPHADRRPAQRAQGRRARTGCCASRALPGPGAPGPRPARRPRAAGRGPGRGRARTPLAGGAAAWPG